MGIFGISSASFEAIERRSPRLDGGNAGKGGDDLLPVPIGDGGNLIDDGVTTPGGRPEERGDGCRSDGDEWNDGDPDDNVDGLNGWTGLTLGLRVGIPTGADGRSFRTVSNKAEYKELYWTHSSAIRSGSFPRGSDGRGAIIVPRPAWASLS